jgi:hypothetical protein
MTPAGLRISPDLVLPLDVVTEATGIVAKRGAGKTNTAAVVVEEAVGAGVQVVVLDPVGAWWGLRSSRDGKKPGLRIPVLGGYHGDVPLEPAAGALVADVVVQTRTSLVLDLSNDDRFPSKRAQAQFAVAFAERLFRAKARQPSAMLLVLEEADEFAPKIVRRDEGLSRQVGAFSTLVRRGRSRGLGVLFITQRTAALHNDVLEQADSLFLHRTTGRRDREAVEAWVVRHSDDDHAAEVIPSLARLADGEAWYWAPERGILQRAQVRRRRTFDSGATPKPGESRVEPEKAATVDLAKLGAEIAATAERAKENDPDELRRRIKELEEKNFRLNALPQIEIMEWARRLFPPLGIREPREGSVAVYLDLIERRVAEVAQQEPQTVEVPVFPAPLRDAIAADYEGIAASARGLLEQVEALARDAKARLDADHGLALQIAPPPRPAPAARRPEPPRRAAPPAAPAATNGHEGLSRSQQAIIDALAWLEAVGVPEPRKGPLALIAGASSKSSGFRNNLSVLSTAGLIQRLADQRVALTEAGRAHAAAPDVAPSRHDVQEAVLGRLSSSQAALLRVLIDAAGEPVDREQLAEAAGVSPSSSGFRNNLSVLSSLEVAYRPDGQTMAAAPILFPG